MRNEYYQDSLNHVLGVCRGQEAMLVAFWSEELYPDPRKMFDNIDTAALYKGQPCSAQHCQVRQWTRVVPRVGCKGLPFQVAVLVVMS